MNAGVSVEQAAQALGVSPATVRRMCKDGRLQAAKVGERTWLITSPLPPRWVVASWSDTTILPEPWATAGIFTDPADVEAVTPFQIITCSSPALAAEVVAALNGGGPT